MKYYTDSHEWVDSSNGEVGISRYAADQIGEVVYAQLPEIGTIVSQGDVICVIESVKAATDIYSPVSGKVVAVNELLLKDLSQLNKQKNMWIYRLDLSDEKELSSLMDETSYQRLIAEV